MNRDELYPGGDRTPSVGNPPSPVSFGRHVYGERIVVSKSAGAGDSIVKIGSFCSVAPGVRCILGGEHRTEWVSTFPFHDDGWARDVVIDPAWGRGNIEIGNDVWIGTDVLLLSGVTIGDGAVIGARSVVTGAVSPYTVVGGNPARFVRPRFAGRIVEELLRIKWWDWPDERIKTAVPWLLSDDVEKFIRAVNRGEL